jgi:hypothetical protein
MREVVRREKARSREVERRRGQGAERCGGKNAKKGFSMSLAPRAAILTKQGVPEDQYPPKLVGFSPRTSATNAWPAKASNACAGRWSATSLMPSASTTGRTPDGEIREPPLRMPGDRMTERRARTNRILTGGDPFSPTKPVKPGVLSVLGSIEFPEAVEGRRTALAKWIASKGQSAHHAHHREPPLALALRQAIAGNPNNFGSTGQEAHASRAARLARGDASSRRAGASRRLHRVIMTSEAYRSEFQLVPRGS